MTKKPIGLRILLIFLAVFILAVLYACFVEPEMVLIKTVRLESDKVERDVNIVFFSDTHIGKGYDVPELKRVAEKINALKPDYVFFAGDLFDNYARYSGDPDRVAEALSKINGAKYAVYGNHDIGGKGKKAFAQTVGAGGFTLLVNQSVLLEEGLNLVGSDDMIFGKPDVQDLFLKDCYNILLAHEPAVFDSAFGQNLQLSGHTHGAQVRVPILSRRLLPYGSGRYISGKYTRDDGAVLYVSRGLGTRLLRMRFFSPPEISQIIISKK